MSDKQVFPVHEASHPQRQHLGLTRRELFAAMAMQGWLSSWPDKAGQIGYGATARQSVAMADALIAELYNP